MQSTCIGPEVSLPSSTRQVPMPCKIHTCCLYLQQPRNNSSAQVSVHIQPTTNYCTSYHQTQQSKSSSKTSNTRFHQIPTINLQIKSISHLLTCKLRSYSRIFKIQFQISRPLFTSQDTSLNYYYSDLSTNTESECIRLTLVVTALLYCI